MKSFIVKNVLGEPVGVGCSFMYPGNDNFRVTFFTESEVEYNEYSKKVLIDACGSMGMIHNAKEVSFTDSVMYCIGSSNPSKYPTVAVTKSMLEILPLNY